MLVWQKGKAICIALYNATDNLPETEKYGVVAQVRRAAISVPSNIAEGHDRNSNADFARFLYIAFGSVRELETLVEISDEIGYQIGTPTMLDELDQDAKMISSLIHKLEG
ncbi:MAG: four helix bundle protein [Armatimonadetes bacterium]|nr:four helix bundle protein [Armatimonadota bacterium]